MIERVDRQTAPLVEGRFYLVPTVRAKWYGKLADWPVVGPLHEDREFFRFELDHYHVDPRFLPRRMKDGVVDRAFSAPLCIPPLPPAMMKRRKCVRSHVDYFLPYFGRDTSPVDVLRKHFAGQQCAAGKGGWICPHRKASLGSIQPVDGIITCPLHGLRIDAATGQVLGEGVPEAD